MLDRLYRALQRSDYDDLAGCTTPRALYRDPVFRELRGRQALAMWHLLCDPGPGLDVRFGDVSAGEQRGSARWEARYDFSRTGGRRRQPDLVGLPLPGRVDRRAA